MVVAETSKRFRIIVGGLACVFFLSPTVGQFVSDPPSAVGLENPCVRSRLGMTSKSPGDNGYRIHISGNPSYYTPGQLYQIALRGTRTQFYLRKFIGFMLTVEAKEEENYISPKPDAGSFNLLTDSLSRFSEECPNAVQESSYLPKDEIEVAWRAPPLGVGCVVFRATVQENAERWYTNEGNLVLELCEEGEKIPDENIVKPEGCCACGRASYELIFQGLWSKETHPKDFPTNEWLIHFSDIIGASHSPVYRMWQDQGYASEGVKDVAEKGATRKLEADLRTKASQIYSIFKAPGLWPPNVNGITSTEFTVNDQHHLVSLVTMLSPSTDWILGVDSLDLCLQNCSWVAENVKDLYLWDAGTADGVTYMSRRQQPTVPQEKIQRITSSEPNDPRSPFYDPTGAPIKPFARLTLRRQQVFEEPCAERRHAAPDIGSDVAENEATTDCPVSDWSEFTPCSVRCGDGVQMRSRHYLDPRKAVMIGCSITLVDKQPCEKVCVGNVSCQTTDWEEWSECSVTCGKGFRTRSRRFLEHRARKVCSVEVSQKETCMGMKPECENPENVNPLCSVTPWSSWSPCTVTCGEGVKLRTRFYLNPSSGSICNEKLMQRTSCNGIKESCTLDRAEAKEICMMPQEVGPCRGYFHRWYFDVNTVTCVRFIYGGCRGNKNNFEFQRDCVTTCEPLFKASGNEDPSTVSTHDVSQGNSPVDCMVTPWSDWTACSSTCGSGWEERRRMVKVPPENGGQPCPENLVERRRCSDNPVCASGNETPSAVSTHDVVQGNSPVDCMVTPWSDWTACSPPCGNGWKERRRMVKVHPENSGQPCPESLVERRNCSYDPVCETCMLPKDPGPCRGYFPRWYFDVNTRRCEQFIYGGCSGNRNSFELQEDCVRTCEAAFTETCNLPKEAGRCSGHFPRWYFDVNTRTCEQFIYSGCRANRNNFELHEDCVRTCEASFTASGNEAPSAVSTHDVAQENSPVDCMVTPWSDWTACSPTCGSGWKERRRMVKVHSENGGQPCPESLVERRRCSDNPICEICMLPTDAGPCRGYFRRWYFDVNSRRCEQFIYGGCSGNRNNFELHQDCVGTCEASFTASGDEAPSAVSTHNAQDQGNSPVDCMLTPWSEWTPCSHTCGGGRKERSRLVKVLPENGGQPCPEKLVQRRRCSDSPPCPTTGNSFHLPPPHVEHRDNTAVDCMVTPWSEWSQCSHTCGSGQKTRQRMIKVHPENGGIRCPEKLIQRRRCSDLPTCPEATAEDETDVDCELSPWSEWAPCSKTCGDYAFMERTRTIIQHPRNNGAPCGHRFDKRYCRLPLCPQ